MAVIYDGKLCIPASELIVLTHGIGSESGFLTKSNFDWMKKAGQLVIARRSTYGNPALVEFESMREDVKKHYVCTYGDPRAQIATQSTSSVLSDMVVYSNEAFEYYSSYRYNGNQKLPPAKIDEYVTNARVIEAVLSLKENRARWTVGGGNTRIKLWEQISKLVNELLFLTDIHGRKLFPHTLPKNVASLKRKIDTYEQAHKISQEEAFRTLIHKNYGNKSASKIQSDESEAILHKLVSLHNNLNSVQVMEEYNKVANVMGLPLISSPTTIDNYKKKMSLTIMPTRNGTAALRNTRLMQIHRSKPEAALTYWTLDGWTAELFYQKRVPKQKGDTQYLYTTYTNRKTAVIVIDACCKYPVGYAIGDNECPALIRQALRNALTHCKSLFGKLYKPLQLQSDNYQKKVMTPFYEAISRYYTPAAVGNAKSKIIEPYFHELNVNYCQKQANWSGFGVTSNKDNQPNLEVINEHRHLIPDEETVIGQIEAIIEQERAKHYDDFMLAWSKTKDESKLSLTDEDYLFMLGETSGRTNRMTGGGLCIEQNGQRIYYDTFDISLREHMNETWIVHYDPEDKRQILISNAVPKGMKDAGKELGTLHYLLQREVKIPMALSDQRTEHVEHRNRVRQFNRDLQQHVKDKNKDVDERIKVITQSIPQLASNNLLDRYLITDSRGQHKDRRSEARQEAIDAEFEDVSKTTSTQKKKSTEDEEEFEFNAEDFILNDF